VCLSEYRKEAPVLLAFFRRDCPTCRLALPFMERLYRRHGRALKFLGILQGASRQEAAGLAKELGLMMPLVLEEAPGWEASTALAVKELPTLILLAVAVHYVMAAAEASRLAETQALQARVWSKEAELKALRAQLHPHFLFNSLNSISALTTVDPERARQMCLLLSDLLRRSLSLGSKEMVALSEEVALVQRFLEVEKVRFGARLQTEVCLDPGVDEWLLPPLLLQPLVENAVTHGIANLVDGGVVRIEARPRGAWLEIAVENPCDPERSRRAGAGVGLDNVRRRLETLYGREARVTVKEADGRFRVELSLPRTRET
jgi:LytS/YehU family sensor histidine kinase